MPFDPTVTRVTCDTRVYGGWYEGASMTRLAQDVSVELLRDFPSHLRIPRGRGSSITTVLNAELAFALLEDPGYHILNTFRRKSRPSNLRIADPATVGCVDPDCVLPLIKHMLRTGTCPKANCIVPERGLIYRNEQKIVDTMLTCDLLYAGAGQVDYLVLISGDDDFEPPVRTVLSRGTPLVRFFPKPISRRTPSPPRAARLQELEL